jgi:hypothetical protein
LIPLVFFSASPILLDSWGSVSRQADAVDALEWFGSETVVGPNLTHLAALLPALFFQVGSVEMGCLFESKVQHVSSVSTLDSCLDSKPTVGVATSLVGLVLFVVIASGVDLCFFQVGSLFVESLTGERGKGAIVGQQASVKALAIFDWFDLDTGVDPELRGILHCGRRSDFGDGISRTSREQSLKLVRRWSLVGSCNDGFFLGIFSTISAGW